MAQNYTLKLTLRQANIVKRSLEEHLKSLQKMIEPLHPEDGTALREEYGEAERLIRNM